MNLNDIKGLAYLTYSGSISYGTDNENSDVDIRGFYVEDLKDIVLNTSEEVIEYDTEDTVIYSVRKFISLCEKANPNVLELLGTREDHILFINEVGKLIRDNRDLFFSKRAFQSFTGYAAAQLRRIQNATGTVNESLKQQHILKALESLLLYIKQQYELNSGTIDFYIENDEIKLNVNLNKIALTQFNAINSDIHTLLRNFQKLNNRNRKKDDEHLFKHAMHLIRLFLTGLDLLNGNGIITYRENDIKLLKDIRNQRYSLDDIFKMADELEIKMKEAYQNSKLPEVPDKVKINQLLSEIYRF